MHATEWMLFMSVLFVLFIALSYPLIYRRTVKRLHSLSSPRKPFVFFDPGKKRWARFLYVSLIVCCLLFLFTIAGIALILNENSARLIPLTGIKKPLSDDDYTRSKSFVAEQLQVLEQGPEAKTDIDSGFTGFYLSNNEDSAYSLKANISRMSKVIATWYTLRTPDSITDRTEPEIDAFVRQHDKSLIALINNNHRGKWDAEVVSQVINDSSRRKWLVDTLHQKVSDSGYAGINIDFENLYASDRDAFTAFIRQLQARFQPDGLEVSVDVAFDAPAYDLRGLSQVADYLYLMVYDEHYANGGAGPVGSIEWVQQALKIADLDPQKTIIALGNYGYDWREGSRTANELTYDEAVSLLGDFKGSFHWDEKSLNPYIRYQDGGEQRVAWYLDGVTFYNQVQLANSFGYDKFALWRLGAEDTSIWQVVEQLPVIVSGERSGTKVDVSALNELSAVNAVHIEGMGEVFSVSAAPHPGKRTFEQDQNGMIRKVSIEATPSAVRLQRYGRENHDKQVVLSFDDGPSSEYTPQILDILKEHRIKATFFVIGSNVIQYPSVLRRVIAEGHEVGNHTFTHPNFGESSSVLRTKLELNATQFAIRALGGHSTALFRPPYTPNVEDAGRQELMHILESYNRGYITVNANVDSKDWKVRSTSAMLNQVRDQLKNGSVILLHDSGPNMKQTVKALPELIQMLKNMGYQFTTIDKLIGKSKSDIMPSLSPAERFALLPFTWTLPLFHRLFDALTFIFIVGIVIGLIRLAVFLLYAYRQKRNSATLNFDSSELPYVSVIIAAYNEENVILSTLQSLLASDYPKMEMIVVDDGSTDQTRTVVTRLFSETPQVRLLSQKNLGKARAINYGIRQAAGSIIVCLDADTQVLPDTLTKLVRHFTDPAVGAVAGNIKVGNVGNLLTSFQHIEYVTGLNLEKRAFDVLNCITVVPGAIGAWRKQALVDVGLFSEETMAEDTDITMKLVANNLRVLYEPHAVAFTEAPETMAGLVRQRVRWSFGILQCAWKYRSHLWAPQNRTFSYIALPSLWLFHFFFQLLVPFGEMLFVLGLFFSFFGTLNPALFLYYFSFIALELLITMIAFRMDGLRFVRVDLFLLQRLFYRQLLAFATIRSAISAIRGFGVSWNKLKREGNVTIAVRAGDESSQEFTLKRNHAG